MYTEKEYKRAVSQVEEKPKGKLVQRFQIEDNRQGSARGTLRIPYMDTAASLIQRKDPVEDAVLSDTNVKEAIDTAMDKIKDKISKWAKKNKNVKKKLNGCVGRDAWVYRGFFGRKDTLQKCIDKWDSNWTIEQTCGLLLDLGNALRHFCQTHEPEENKKTMTDIMKGSRKTEHKVDRQSRWALEFVPAGTKLQSGVSATTGNLLRVIRELDVNTIDEIESIMVGVIKYWKNGSWIKWLLGQFHTAAEVWSAYTYYLERFYFREE